MKINKVISIVGPTATGKTNQALKLAREILARKEFAGVDLISVDSRQVYQGLEVLTGADVPTGFSQSHAQIKMPYFANQAGSIRFFGIAMINTQDEWSVNHFRNFARKILLDSWYRQRLPILVGGTGLYHRQLFSDLEDINIKPNPQVRAKAEHMDVAHLQAWLGRINEERWLKMNNSDRGNKRRLVRAIEISLSRSSQVKKIVADLVHPRQVIWSKVDRQVIELSAELGVLKAKIKLRVKKRFRSGAVDEVKALLKLKLNANLPVMSTLGVPEITSYLGKKLSAQETINLWALHEFQYAKRQITWWKK